MDQINSTQPLCIATSSQPVSELGSLPVLGYPHGRREEPGSEPCVLASFSLSSSHFPAPSVPSLLPLSEAPNGRFPTAGACPKTEPIEPLSSSSGSSLGNLTKAPTPPENTGLTGLLSQKPSIQYPTDAIGSRLERFALQSVSRSILGSSSRIYGCLRHRIKGVSHVAVKYSPTRSRASYGNLQVCGSVWSCPICASKISEHRRNELIAITEAHKANGGGLSLITRTFPHTSQQSLETLLEKLSKAENAYKSGNPWKRIVQKYQIIGSVRALETTIGINGWHPHIHEIIFTAEPLSVSQLENLKFDLYNRWSSACIRADFPTPSPEHGLDVQDGTFASRYVSKWGIEAELTKAVSKKGKSNSLSPFDLLRIGMDGGPNASLSLSLFSDYALAFKGRRQLVYSPGLRNLYTITPEITDEEASKGSSLDDFILSHLSPIEWKYILRNGLRGQLLEAVNQSKGSETTVSDFLKEHLG